MSKYVKGLERRVEELQIALQDLAYHHAGWHHGMGSCVCIHHKRVNELGLQYETPATKDKS